MYSRTLTNLTSPVQISECVSISKMCFEWKQFCMVQLLFNAHQNTTCVWMSLFWVFTIVRSTVIIPCIFSPHWGWWEFRCDQWCSSPPAAPHCHVLPSEYRLPHHRWCPPYTLLVHLVGKRRISSHVLVGFLLLTIPRPSTAIGTGTTHEHVTRSTRASPRPRPPPAQVHVCRQPVLYEEQERKQVTTTKKS